MRNRFLVRGGPLPTTRFNLRPNVVEVSRAPSALPKTIRSALSPTKIESRKLWNERLTKKLCRDARYLEEISKMSLKIKLRNKSTMAKSLSIMRSTWMPSPKVSENTFILVRRTSFKKCRVGVSTLKLKHGKLTFTIGKILAPKKVLIFFWQLWV